MNLKLEHNDNENLITPPAFILSINIYIVLPVHIHQEPSFVVLPVHKNINKQTFYLYYSLTLLFRESTNQVDLHFLFPMSVPFYFRIPTTCFV